MNEHNAKNINNQSALDKSWWNNGIKAKISMDCPGDGWVKGRLPSHVESAAAAKKKNYSKKYWWFCVSNGEIALKEKCPGDGWIKGRPDISKNQTGKKKPKTSKSLKGKHKSKEHKLALSKSKQKQRDIYMGENNVMNDPLVREKHRQIVNSKEYRDKVSRGVLNSDRWTPEKRKEHGERVSKLMSGGKNPSAKSITIDGVVYETIKSVCDSLNLSRYEIKKILKKSF